MLQFLRSSHGWRCGLGSPLRILHISDLHSRGDRESETWRRRRVLGEAWERNSTRSAKTGRSTWYSSRAMRPIGDFPTSSRPRPNFSSRALEKLRVPRERFFVIPGNHDVRRDVRPTHGRKCAALLAAEQRHVGYGALGRGRRGPIRSGGRPDGSRPRPAAAVLGLGDEIARSVRNSAPRKGTLGFHSELDLGAGYPITSSDSTRRGCAATIPIQANCGRWTIN